MNKQLHQDIGRQNVLISNLKNEGQVLQTRVSELESTAMRLHSMELELEEATQQNIRLSDLTNYLQAVEQNLKVELDNKVKSEKLGEE